MTQTSGRRIKQGQLYDFEGVNVISSEFSSRRVVRVAEILENPPGVKVLGKPMWVHASRLKEVGTRYTQGEIP